MPEHNKCDLTARHGYEGVNYKVISRDEKL